MAGFFNGAFALPLRYARSWEWENTWLVFSCFSLILLPWVAAFIFVPAALDRFFMRSPSHLFLARLIAGVFWGLSFVLYGLGLDMVGIAVGNAVVASMSTIAGTLGPLIVYAPDKLLTSTGLVLIDGHRADRFGNLHLRKSRNTQRRRKPRVRRHRQRAGQGSFRAGYD